MGARPGSAAGRYRRPGRRARGHSRSARCGNGSRVGIGAGRRGMSALASAVQVSKRFGHFTAVREVDLEVAPGEIVGLLGANGAGKTTLIRMLLGLVSTSAGEVALFGEAPSRFTRSRIGYVPQGLGLYDDLSAEENMEF